MRFIFPSHVASFSRLPRSMGPALIAGALSLAAVPAMAQTASGMAPMGQSAPMPESATGARPGHVPGVGPSLPLSNKASNIGSSDTTAKIAPTLPGPGLGENASSDSYLRAARAALAAGQTGVAQESLGRAETQLLSRSVPQGETMRVSSNPRVTMIEQARKALGAGDRAGAMQIIDQALTH
ncbi:MAG: hypothetical protein KGL12_14490 [Rhodospirillales bacterium]|nr:hypothetical protein [Rhodospirillales bacterium]